MGRRASTAIVMAVCLAIGSTVVGLILGATVALNQRLATAPTQTPSSTPTPRAGPKTESEEPVAPPARKGCAIEGWRYYEDGIGNIWIEGGTTCARGQLTIRAYDRKKLLGTATTYIESFAFKTYVSNAEAPRRLSIRYVVAE